MVVDYLIIGQGISGSFLSWYLHQEHKSFVVIDKADKNSASRIAAGIINPVTGRRMVTVWMADEVMNFAWKAYQEIGQGLSVQAISQKSIIDQFPNPFMRESFLKRMDENASYLHSYPEQNQFNPYFNYEFGCGEIRPAYTAHLETLLPAWRNYLAQKKVLLDEQFDHQQLKLKEHEVIYKDVTAAAVIFCDGAAGAENPFFQQLPFAPNKGEALILEIPGLPDQHVYKKSMTLAPLAVKDLFWLGSVYQWKFDNASPTGAFLEQAKKIVKEWLKIPFIIVNHLASVRPATLERRPFVGIHPMYKNVGILNGMGTKGCSLAPYFARQLVDHLLYHTPVDAEADINRFRKILSR